MGIVDVELLPGIREDFSPRRLPPGWLTEAKNVRYGRQGGIRPRPGTAAIGRSGAIGASSTIGLVTRSSTAPLVGVAGSVVTYEATRARWDYAGNYSTARPVRKRTGLSSLGQDKTVGQTRSGVAVNASGYVCSFVSASGGSGTCYILIESPTGERVALRDGITGLKAAVVAVGDVFYCTYQASSTDVRVKTVTASASGLTTAADTSLATLHSSGSYWDITPAANGTDWFLAFHSAATTVTVRRYTGTSSAASTTQTVPAEGPVSLYASATDVWLGWFDPSSGVVAARTFAPSTLSTRSNATTLATDTLYGPPLFGPRAAGGVFYVHRKNTSTEVVTGAGYASSPGSASNITFQAVRDALAAIPISKPDSDGRFWCVVGVGSGYTTQRCALVRIQGDSVSTFGPHSIELVTRAYEQPVSAPALDMFHHIAESGSTHFFLAPEMLQNAVSSGVGEMFRLQCLEYEAGFELLQSATVSDDVAISNGQPRELPGAVGSVIQTNGVNSATYQSGAPEIGFLHPPAVLSATQKTGGNLDLLGTYTWVFVYEWLDRFGRIHRSAPSQPYQTTLTGSNNAVEFEIAGISLTDRLEGGSHGPRIMVYRSLAGGSTPQRATNYDYALLATVSSQTITDGIADSEIDDEAFEHTAGGVQHDAIAPSCRFTCRSEDRVWFGGLWDRTLIQCSKVIVPEEPVRCTDSDAFKVVIPEAVTALAYLDGNVIAFGERGIYAVSGSGPNDQGVGEFAPPRAIARDHGAVASWTLETAAGVFFQSRRGIELLPRGLGSPIFVGAAVQRLMQDYPTVLGAAVYDGRESRSARFLCTNGTGEIVLVYDLDIAAGDPLAGWSYDTFADRLGMIGEWPSGVALAKTDLSSSSHAFYLDEFEPQYERDASNTENITSSVETGDLRFAGLAGWCSVHEAAGVFSEGDGGSLTMTVTADGGDSGSQSTSRTWTMPADSAEQYRFVHPTQPQCSRASVRFDVARTTNVRGPTLHGLTLNVAADRAAEAMPRRALEAER